jgi:hypothetical protein
VSNLSLFLGDGVSAIVVVGAGFDVAASTTIDVWGTFSFGGFTSVNRVDYSINLVVGRSPGGFPGDVVDTFFVRGVFGATDERRVV